MTQDRCVRHGVQRPVDKCYPVVFRVIAVDAVGINFVEEPADDARRGNRAAVCDGDVNVQARKIAGEAGRAGVNSGF
ncbi:hypothetical protein SDC9_152379 [bioreactor metagenome]|uniref:Uncharacterized protein n=1 Tax=bioreactor metagenome TaxID=1076179 RepID=A0A645EV93_9ZZZZ